MPAYCDIAVADLDLDRIVKGRVAQNDDLAARMKPEIDETLAHSWMAAYANHATGCAERRKIELEYIF